MIVAINYSNDAYLKSRKLNSFTAKFFGRVNKVISYGPNDIDKEFKDKYSETLSAKRGNGYWLWKPYFIKKTLSTINEGDYLIYSDSGMCYIRKIDDLILKMNKAKQDIFLTELPLLEIQFTHPEVLKRLNGDKFKFTNQIQANVLIFKKTEFSIKFINDWLSLCQDKNFLIANNYKNINENLFISHREDQSILSLLAKKNGIRPFMDVSDYGRFPFQYFNTGYLFRLKQKEIQYSFSKTYFLLFRKQNPIIYSIKYFVKYMFSKINFF
tara:strand:+ start:204 stop:1010 length:807 start_codon:yes stop_codon:yes gene_type:complete